jgi:hypothetical protein
VNWSVTVSAWGNRNRLETLGGSVSQVVLSPVQRHVPGFPLGGFWAVPLDSVRDVNGDGLIGSSEVFFDPAKDAVYVGSSAPTRGGALGTALSLGRRVTLSGLLEYRGGDHTFNLTERSRCIFSLCAGLNLSSTSLEEKSDAAAAFAFGPSYNFGYIEDAGFLKLRELSLEVALPDAWTHRLGAARTTVTLAGRNLGTWSHYSSPDPEVNSRRQDNFLRVDGFSQPQVRYFLLRVSAAY